MRLALVLALLQQPATPPGFPITQIEITPATAAVEVGQKIQLAARALDASGQPVAGAVVHWFVASTDGSVDSTGLVTGGYAGAVRVAAVAALPGQPGQKIEFALVHVLPEAPARIVVEPAATDAGISCRSARATRGSSRLRRRAGCTRWHAGARASRSRRGARSLGSRCRWSRTPSPSSRSSRRRARCAAVTWSGSRCGLVTAQAGRSP